MQEGIFSKLKKSDDLVNGENVLFFSRDYLHLSTQFCGINEISGGPPSNLADGSQSTAWSNDVSSEEYQYFIIDFINKRVRLNGYMIEIICSPPNAIEIEGSNNMIKWHLIDHNDTSLNIKSRIDFQCNSHKSYRNIKFKQIDINQNHQINEYRFILNNIELYGEITFFYQNTCKCYINNKACFLFCHVIFIHTL